MVSQPFPAQRPVLKDNGLPNFLCGNRKEEGHQHVVHKVVETQHLRGRNFGYMELFAVFLEPIARIDPHPVVHPQGELNHVMVAVRIRIRPDQSNQRADDQQQRIVRHKIPDAIHALAPHLVPLDLNECT